MAEPDDLDVVTWFCEFDHVGFDFGQGFGRDAVFATAEPFFEGREGHSALSHFFEDIGATVLEDLLISIVVSGIGELCLIVFVGTSAEGRAAGHK